MEPEELELPSAPAATPRSDIADAPPPPPDITDNAPPPPPPPDTTGASQAAQALLDQAKLAESRGDDDQAIKLVALSLKTYELEEAEALQKYLEAFGTGSAAAQTVQKMLEPRASYYQIMKLSNDASGDQVKKAFKQLSLQVHPDRNHARRAEEAFKVLHQAFTVLADPTARSSYDAAMASKPRSGSGTGRPGSPAKGGGRSSTHRQQEQQQQRARDAAAAAARASAAFARGTTDPHDGGSNYGPFAHDFTKRWRQRQERNEKYAYASSGSDASARGGPGADDAERLRAELAAIKEEKSRNERAHREQVAAARRQGYTDARDAMGRLSEQLAQSERRNSQLRKEVEAEAARKRKVEVEHEALTGAVKALAARLQKHDGAGVDGGWRTVSSEAEMRQLMYDALQRTLGAATEQAIYGSYAAPRNTGRRHVEEQAKRHHVEEGLSC